MILKEYNTSIAAGLNKLSLATIALSLMAETTTEGKDNDLD